MSRQSTLYRAEPARRSCRGSWDDRCGYQWITATRDIPPIAFMEGIDLVTEELTLRKAIELLKRYLIECDLSSEFFSELDKKNGASMIAKILIEDCTELHMFVGTARTAPTRIQAGVDLGIRQNLVKHKEAVEGMGKESYGNVLIRRIKHGNE